MFGMALAEVKNGKKQSHWMWYIFPQLKGIGKTTTSYYYGISSLEEARDFLKHPILGSRLYEITQALLEVKGKTAFEIFGTPDYLKLKSCMTLFKLAAPQESVFQEVINTYYMGYDDELTRMKLNL
ncbi:hypothetical protein P700755_002136 [Psychroflexus torquis ATCC 700755]|uniref:Calpastatin n=2 Tax=Psychroflexus TaxID=83612 RepID=K4IEE0_PSYTT|nr:hypothetical protein P700755_002136 [Psychroflexus torquis ATCC 700755]